MNIGPAEFTLIMFVALLVLGPKQLPTIGRAIGKAMSAYRSAMREVEDQVRNLSHDIEAVEAVRVRKEESSCSE